jgi:uncharacterized protein
MLRPDGQKDRGRLSKDRATHQSILVEPFEDGTGYAIDLKAPQGVKYLRSGVLARLKSLLHTPQPRARSDPQYDELARNGLVAATQASSQKDSDSFLAVWLHISNACNLSCAYCYIPHVRKADSNIQRDTLTSPMMSGDACTAYVHKLFAFCTQAGIRRLKIKFTGGEPTLNPDCIRAACETASALSVTTGIQVDFRLLTNGVFDVASLAPLLRRHRLGVCISVDGAQADHDRIRFLPSRTTKVEGERSGTWSDINRSIDALLELEIKPYLLCTVTPANVEHLREFVDFTISRGLGFRFSMVRDAQTHATSLVAPALVDLYRWLGGAYPVEMPIERFARFGEWNLRKPRVGNCGAARFSLAVGHNGDVSSCQMRLDRPSGNLTQGTLASAYAQMRNDPQNSLLVSPEDRGEPCLDCRWRYLCSGGCPEHARLVSATHNAPSPWCGTYASLLPVYIEAVARQLKRGIDARFRF